MLLAGVGGGGVWRDHITGTSPLPSYNSQQVHPHATKSPSFTLKEFSVQTFSKHQFVLILRFLCITNPGSAEAD